jgi:hypothetical protein
MYTKTSCTNFRLMYYARVKINDFLHLTKNNRYSFISKMMHCGLDNWYSVPRYGRSFLFAITSRPAMVMTQPPSQWLPGAPTLGIKWLEHEANYSTPSRIIVSRAWTFISTSPTCLHRDNFT